MNTETSFPGHEGRGKDTRFSLEVSFAIQGIVVMEPNLREKKKTGRDGKR